MGRTAASTPTWNLGANVRETLDDRGVVASQDLGVEIQHNDGETSGSIYLPIDEAIAFHEKFGQLLQHLAQRRRADATS